MPRLIKNIIKERVEAGCDEVGRGCLAGPVVAGAVIFKAGQRLLNGLDDSKKLSKQNREKLAEKIKKQSLSWAIAEVEPAVIDEINILQASVLAMNKAIEKLDPQPEFVQVDGHYFHTKSGIPFETFKKGDGRFAAIAAASIIAKVHRDNLMESLHNSFPQYHWKSNKGYPSKVHREAIRETGASAYHRKSFRLYEEWKQMKLEL